MLVREFISDIRNSLHSINLDDWIPGKFIHNKGLGYASLFIKREADDKRMYKYTNLFTPVSMLMEEKALIQMGSDLVPNCKKVMKAKVDLPTMYSTRHGYLMNVTSVDYGKDYIPTTPQQYKYVKSREFQDLSLRYFWLENNRIIIPDALVQQITITGMFQNRAEALRIGNCDCFPLLDQEFIAPEHLLKDIKDATILDLMKTYRSINSDEYPNLNENEKENDPIK